MSSLNKPLQSYLHDKKWNSLLASEFDEPYWLELEEKLVVAYETKTIYPLPENIFTAFNLTSFDNIKVVIIGQDPYHNEGQAHGLSFSVQPGIKLPPSLVNIYKELESDLGIKSPGHGYLKSWADHGVLLLNAILTVEAGKPMSHKNFGWEKFTDRVIDLINEKKENVVFILWGSPAHLKAKKVDEKKHFVIKCVHPSPLSSYRGFFGSKPFSKCNEFLGAKEIGAVDWRVFQN